MVGPESIRPMPLRFVDIRDDAARKGLQLERTEHPGWYRLRASNGAELTNGRGIAWTLSACSRYLDRLPDGIG